MNLKIKILIALFALGTLFLGCDDFMYDEFNDCPHGVYVRFYSLTTCADDTTFIGDVSSLTLFAFDENNKLTKTITEENISLTSDYELFIPIDGGYFTFIAWTGVEHFFTRSTFVEGVTTKQDLMATINASDKLAADLKSTRVWQGESPAIFLPAANTSEEVKKHTAINLSEITNRIKIIVEFDKSITELTPKDLVVSLASANGTFNIDGSMPLNTPKLTYPLQNTTYTNNRVTWDYTLLDLLTGYHNKLTITYPKDGSKVFDGDLIATILLNTVEGGVNLACENDFTVKFVVKDYCAECGEPVKPGEPGTLEPEEPKEPEEPTEPKEPVEPEEPANPDTRFSCAIYVNDWLVHTYSTELGL